MTYTVAFCGFGVTGLSAFDQLIRRVRGTRGLRIVCIESSGEFGCGDPYGTSPIPYILNQPAYLQSPFPNQPEDYANWLKQYEGDQRYDFTLRETFGKYLVASADRLIWNHARLCGIEVDLVQAKVTDIERQGERGFRITVGNDAHKLDAQHVVTALGHARAHHFDHLSSHPGFARDPYDLAALQTIAATARPETVTTIFGNGASAIDTIVALEHLGFCGKYRILSANGWSPWPFEPEKYDPRLEAPTLILSERTIRNAGEELQRGGEIEQTLIALYHTERQRDPRIGYFHVIKAFPFAEIASELDKAGWPGAAQKILAYQTHCYSNPAPPQTIERLAALKRAGRLEVRVGKIERIEAAETGFTAYNANGGRFAITHLVNAVPIIRGIGTRPEERSALYNSMIAKGLIRTNDKGIIVTDKEGLASPSLWSIGAPSHSGLNLGVESCRPLAAAAGQAVARNIINAKPSYDYSVLYSRVSQPKGAFYAYH